VAVHWVLPVVAAAAAAAFAVAVLRQYARRRRPYQLAWGVALAMFALASAALAVGVAAGWTPLRFKVYYLFGAILNVPWLALGTVLLLARRRAIRIGYLAALVLFSLASAVAIVLVEVDAAELAGRVVPEGSQILPVGIRVLAVVGNVVGTLVVVGGAVASGLAIRGRPELRPRFEGNLLIAAGVLLAAAGGVFAFLSASDKLAVGLALGATVMYAGFRRASTPARTPSPTAGAPGPGGSPPPPPRPRHP
jgi:hypothetical protein